MKFICIFLSVFGLLMLTNPTVDAQSLTIKGKVIDGENGDAIPFANVYPKNNIQGGSTTDFDGYYTLTVDDLKDSIVVSYIGYIPKIKPILIDQAEDNILQLNFQLASESQLLEEIVVKAGEDPSVPIMKEVIKHKKYNDKQKLNAFEYESYVKVELDVDNVSEKFGKRKIIKQVTQAIDSAGGLTGEDGKPLIPLFLSESISRYYYRRNPERVKEHVIKTKIDGVGLGDASPVSQILGSTFQEYNFYRNWMKVLNKDFISPMADGWRLYYDTYLADSMMVGKHWCYKIEVVPKRKEDLAFDGVIWVDSETYALKQIDVRIAKSANINFVEKIRIQQELIPTREGPWLPSKNRILVDIAELSEKSAGLLAKFYVSNKDFTTGKEYPLKFYKEQVEVEVDALDTNADYWTAHRHDSLTVEELKTYGLIETIKEVPIVKTYSEVISILTTGHKRIGPVDFGNYAYTYGFNNVEGHRFRLGMRTNQNFSTKVELKGYAAYGTEDERFKYGGRIRYIPSRKNWTEFIVERSDDITQVAINPDGVNVPWAFLASLSFFDVKSRSPFYKQETIAYLQRDIFKGFRQTVKIRHNNFQQIGNHFAYYNEPTYTESSIRRNFSTAEVIFETRLAKNERFFHVGNNRFSLGTRKLPIVTLRYTLGFDNFLGSDFSYHKFGINLEQNLLLGFLGNSYYSLTAGYTNSVLPYPLLDIHLGNKGIFYNFYGFGLMNYLEFVSDQHVSLNYEHNFNGLIANRIPLLKKLKFRTFVAANVLVGNLSDANKAIIPATDLEGNAMIQPNGLGDDPYIEIGYGISNIFKFFRVTFLHRINYLQNPDIRKFGVFFSARFDL